jgi:hypothetical protein
MPAEVTHGVAFSSTFRYVGEGEAISFWELAERARVLGEVALGWRTASDDIEINPPNKVRIRQRQPFLQRKSEKHQ